MMDLQHFAERLVRDEEGATIVEFSFVALPMILILMGGVDLGYQSYVRSVMQGSLNEAARRAAVRDPSFTVPGATVEEKVENHIKNITNGIARKSTISVTQQSYFDFSSIGNPEKLMTDNNGNGKFDADDGDCWEDANNNGTFDNDQGKVGRGGANDVVFYTADISMPRLMPWHNFIPGMDSDIAMTMQTAVRSQPYGNQATKPVICATPT